jgi:hypothetical protein
MGGIVQVDSVLNNNTSNLITQTNSTTITIGSTGQTISLASGASSSGFGLTWNPTVQTTNFTASVGVGYMVNTTTAAITATLPAAPSIGDQVAFVDFNETAATNAIILDPNGLKIDGGTSSSNIANGGEGVTILYSGTTRGWIPVSAANEGTTALVSQFSLDFLVIAGGGSGGTGDADRRAGGGAGGYRTSTQLVTQGTVITVTVGDGGSVRTNGSNSSISGSGLTTITSAGGGAGGAQASVGDNGGSGGGGAGSTSGSPPGAPGTSAAGGSGNTPSTSPSQGNNGGIGRHLGGIYAAGGGGGGAGGVGQEGNNTPPNSSNGGAGSASSITGSSVTRAGGGGGNGSDSIGGAGGTGGGGTGGNPGTAGTANTGGGGGSNAAGGKGVVILSIATIHYTGTSSGSPTVTTSGSNTILQFNGSGTYTV